MSAPTSRLASIAAGVLSAALLLALAAGYLALMQNVQGPL